MPEEPTPTESQDTPAAPEAAAEKPKRQKPAAAEGAPAAKAEKPKKEKAPALEDKPFVEFMNQDYLPKLKQMMETLGVTDLTLTFEKRSLPIKGLEEAGDCWQVLGDFKAGQRQFLIGFLKEDIQSQKVFAYAEGGAKPSTLESFMIDERKVTLDLLLLYTVQRLNGQKWLVRN
ncbi:DUF2996 domain-containing protein [Oscillatoria sp. FACHB-1407]|uniref:DUF2996 domain-containing protein n=1 Tax=Oscillatoria sp. FACHB-1407 TaxID=2692847 RepID=UPI001688D377|nr:DUF2996 domain-containing protein [Oscillatoria sp. FACHB-1407]MBD2463343.1 DUF2996 domain-containing protein [Oscillatoria sp. FACHB-1407]